jgi:hypothetical protein
MIVASRMDVGNIAGPDKHMLHKGSLYETVIRGIAGLKAKDFLPQKVRPSNETALRDLRKSFNR